ncbi:MlaD family protein [Nocardia sp. NPDC055321]
MPHYGMPGVQVDRRQALAAGAVITVVVTAIVVAWTVTSGLREPDRVPVTLRTERIGEGIRPGVDVRLDGLAAGTVDDIEPGERGTQYIRLRLDPEAARALDDSMLVDYAAANLFGISEIDLRRGAGGAPLRAGAVIDLTGPGAAKAYDATMGSLLRSLSQVTNDVLTPQLSNVLARIASDVGAFTPLLQSMVVLARTVADTRTVPLSEQFGAYGSTLDGVGVFAGAIVDVIGQAYRIDVLRTDRAKFDATIDMVVQRLFPALQNTLYHAADQFSEYAGMLAPILSGAAAMVPEPQRSSAELRALLDSLRAAMPDTGAGPVLNVDLDLRLVPALAVPLGATGEAR